MKVRELMMSEMEICSSYRRSENKNRQVDILSELNACRRIDVIAILQKRKENIDCIRKKVAGELREISRIEIEEATKEKLEYVYGKE